MINYFKDNIYNLISTSFGLIGIVLAVIFYIKSTKNKKPFFSIFSFSLFNKELKKISDIEIKFNANIVENLTVTKLAIWNGGKDTINKSDIPENARIMIKTPKDIIIYGTELVFQNEMSNNMRLFHDKEKNEVAVDFDYLDYNQGGIIRILHSGDSSKDILISGKVKGFGSFRNIPDPIFIQRTNDKSDYRANVFVLLLMILGSVVGVIFLRALAGKIIFSVLGLSFLYAFIYDIRIPKFPESLYSQFND